MQYGFFAVKIQARYFDMLSFKNNWNYYVIFFHKCFKRKFTSMNTNMCRHDQAHTNFYTIYAYKLTHKTYKCCHALTHARIHIHALSYTQTHAHTNCHMHAHTPIRAYTRAHPRTPTYTNAVRVRSGGLY